jgi:dTDP-4-amino-4,6-dideoxygalactose transaminase
VERRRELVQQYSDLLADQEDVRLLTEIPGRRSSYHLLVAQLRGGSERRRAVFEKLQAAGIRAQVHYIPVHLQPWYAEHFEYRQGAFPQAECYYAGCVSLPLFPRMSEADVQRSAAALQSALAETRKEEFKAS